MLLVIIFGGVFFTVLMGLSGFVLSQNRTQDLARERAEATSLAEAGINYYLWFLSHFPGDTTNGTGHAGPYTLSYADPEGGVLGTYTLSVSGRTACGVVQSIDVTSVGKPSDAPGVSATITAHYAQPSIAEYSMIVNASTWFDGTIFRGPMHSNGGLRMDNTSNNAPVTSSLSSWSCGSSFGCSPTRTVAGIFGNGLNQDLWSYPTPQTDFAGINSDFSSRKALAQASGLYFARYSTSGNPHRGYHLVFNNNGTVTVTKVSSVSNVLMSIPVDGSTGYAHSVHDYSLITGESAVGTYAIPPSCSLIFVEDNVWLEGTIPSKITVVAADVAHPGVYPDVVLRNNIVYTAFDGSVGLTVIASHNILIGPDTPQDLTLDGLFVAQSGAFGRNLYACDMPLYQYRGKLSMLGTIVSMLRQNNYWIGVCSSGQGAWSGYPDSQWTFVFDRQNSVNAPPFTPNTSAEWQIVDWQQK
jgi:hypothetical protein